MKLKTTAALGSTAAGLGALINAGYQGLHYSAWSDPGALNSMVQSASLAVIFFAVPAAMLLIWFVRQFAREMSRTGLTPTQVAVAEAAVLAAAHYEWRKHNERVSERLTESVMGPERTELWPGE